MKLRNALIVCSPTCEEDKTQTSVIYIATVLNELNIEFDVLELSGLIDYYDPPKQFFSPCDSIYWLSHQVFHDAHWLDAFLPSEYLQYDVVFYSSFFSPDVLIHGRHALNQKRHYPESLVVAGGPAVSCLSQKQLSVLSQVFDYLCKGYDTESLIRQIISKETEGCNSLSECGCIHTDKNPRTTPNYGLLKLRPFITVFSGNGCYWGKCSFCNSTNSITRKSCYRPAKEIADDFLEIRSLNGKISEVMLSSDSFTKRHLMEVSSCLTRRGIGLPYNLMLRGEEWISDELGKLLEDSGCTDVFIGAEAFDDDMLKVLRKGTNSSRVIDAVKRLSRWVEVSLGLLLFVPNANERQLDQQLNQIEGILPYIYSIEPEILTVIQGTEFFNNPKEYGINLWAKDRTINDSWCFGLSPNVPWVFDNKREVEMWFRYYEKLKNLIEDFVEPHYWNSVDRMRLRF